MAGELIVPGSTALARPSHLTAFDGEKTNLVTMSIRVPTFTMQAKVFGIQANGRDVRLTANVQGEQVPLPSLPMILLGFNPLRGRAYYEGAFDPKNIKPPECFSKDGITPSDTSPVKQADKCAICPKSMKGSKINDNQQSVAACAEHRLVCVIPYKALHADEIPPLRLRLPVTSDYDGRNDQLKSEGRFAFSQYVDHIRQRGAKHSYEIVTKVAFDHTPGITYPKLTFQAQAWIDERDAERIAFLRQPGNGVDLCLDTDEGEVAAQAAAAQGGEASPQTTAQRSTVADPDAAKKAAAAEAKKAAAAEAKRVAAAKKAEEEEAAKAEHERQLAAEAQAEAAKATGNLDLGDSSDLGGSLGDDTPAAATAAAATAQVDAKNPPAAVPLADDADIDDIMKQWSGD